MNSHAEFNTIAALDLDPIKVKLMHKQSGEGWSLERANAVELEYRRFLFLSKLYPNEEMAPLLDVDTFWHYHILDTMKYAADCEQAFGYFLHHFPYVGLGEVDEAEHATVGVRMKELYAATFGPMVEQDGTKGASAWCSLNGQQAWCSLGGKHAVPSIAGATAWCSLGGKDAVSSNTGATAWCSLGGKTDAASTTRATAWCSLGGKKAASRSAGDTAWCSLSGKTASSSIMGKTAWCSLNGKTAWCSLDGRAKSQAAAVIAHAAAHAARSLAAPPAPILAA